MIMNMGVDDILAALGHPEIFRAIVTKGVEIIISPKKTPINDGGENMKWYSSFTQMRSKSNVSADK